MNIFKCRMAHPACAAHATSVIHVLHSIDPLVHLASMKIDPPRVLAHSWLLLIHQLPAKPAYLRVKTWRRLQDLGAVAVKNAVHALPMNEETQEDFEWLLREIREGGGEAFVCEARLIDGLSDEEVRALFDRARDAVYAELAKGAQSIAKALRRKARGNTTTEFRA